MMPFCLSHRWTDLFVWLRGRRVYQIAGHLGGDLFDQFVHCPEALGLVDFFNNLRLGVQADLVEVDENGLAVDIGASSEQRKTTTGAIFSGLEANIWLIIASNWALSVMPAAAALFSQAALSSGVTVMRVAALGRMALQVMPYLPRSSAAERVKPTMPSLAAL